MPEGEHTVPSRTKVSELRVGLKVAVTVGVNKKVNKAEAVTPFRAVPCDEDGVPGHIDGDAAGQRRGHGFRRSGERAEPS